MASAGWHLKNVAVDEPEHVHEEVLTLLGSRETLEHVRLSGERRSLAYVGKQQLRVHLVWLTRSARFKEDELRVCTVVSDRVRRGITNLQLYSAMFGG